MSRFEGLLEELDVNVQMGFHDTTVGYIDEVALHLELLPGYKNICAFVESRILKNQKFKIKIVACIPAKNGYPVEIRDPKHPHYIGQRRFNTVIDLYPSLTRDPSMLLSLSNPGQDFTTISFDFSITGSKQERGHDLRWPVVYTNSNMNTNTNANKKQTGEASYSHENMTHGLSSMMRLRPSAAVYEYMSESEYDRLIEKRRIENFRLDNKK
ncbi:hypothetical protein SARC_06537 [Sphaeroforma arctica JP610]|uniref:Uncharacterized protein n=1 Tax=Sphaeroforma arctica JP610 TaxID=667725 RepID=A0A0L0FWC4_9EUKA|nr:hypothetical protein SARC_06537 [Sphaeroforma arctica JP610]KNC81112.1 hypothetical protein SARC_06537 [Sphaeroforma arctica JP610]|eukprot:XP_014155014.1 hypothetical protein SARC_06537 [Sphaeroforma arctica JP610]